MATDGPTVDHSISTSANEAFKSHYGDWVGFGVIVAVAIHFAFFTLFPNLKAADLTGDVDAARPATPKVSATTVDEDVTIAPTTFESNPVENLAPPPATTGSNPDERPTFIPYDIPPKLKNPSDIQRYLKQHYPPTLREARIEGKVILWIYIDRAGQVQRAQVQQTSGFDAMDRVALECAGSMEFTPAKNRDKTTPVWVQPRSGFSRRSRSRSTEPAVTPASRRATASTRGGQEAAPSFLLPPASSDPVAPGLGRA
jgi:TonB family protein